MIDIIDENLFCPLNVSQINKDHTLLGPPRSGKSTFAHYNNLELNEEEIGFVNIEKEKYSTEKILDKIKNAITAPFDKVFGKFIKVEEFKKQFSNILSEKDMRKILGNLSQEKISTKIVYHIDTLLKSNKTPILYWLNLEEIRLKGYSNEEIQKYAKVNWLGIDYYPPKLLKYDLKKLKEAQDNYEKFCSKMGIPVSGEDFYKIQKPTFFIGFFPQYAGNVLSRLSGYLGNIPLPGIIPAVISTSIVPLISGVIVMSIMTLMVKKENADVKAEIIEIVNGWGKLDEEFKHIVAAKIAFETGFTEEEVFNAYEKLSGISENQLLSKIMDQIRPELDELRKEIENLKEQLYAKGTEKIKDINMLRDKLNIKDRDENLIGLGNSENDREVGEKIDRIINNSKDHICIIEGGPGSGKTTLLYMVGKSLLYKGIKVYYIEESGPFSFIDFPKLDAYALYDVKDRKIAEKILGEKLKEAILNNTPLARIIISVRTSYLMDSKFNELKEKDRLNGIHIEHMVYSEPILREMAIRSLKNSFPNISQDHLDEASKILATNSEGLPIYIKDAVKMLEEKGFSLEFLKNLPYGVVYYDYKGNSLLESKRYEDAIEFFDMGIRLNPDDPGIHNNKGNALFKMQRYQEAIVEFDKAIELNPNNPDHHYNKGIVLLEMQRYQEAIVEFDKAIELNPKDPYYHYNKGNSLLESKRYEDAIEEFNKAIMLNPNHPSYHNNKGNALNMLKRHEEAIEEYDKAIELNPNNPDYHKNKAITLYVLQRYQEAIVEFDKAIELNPNNPDHHYIKGIVLLEMQRYQEAIVEFDKAIELDSSDPSYYYYKGLAQEKLNQNSKRFRNMPYPSK